MYSEDLEEDLDLRAVLDKYVIHWRWFVLAVGVSLFLAILYLRYTTPQYEASSTILVKDEKKGGMLSELSAFADMGLGGGMKNNVDNEIEILKSRSLVENVVKKLDLNIALFTHGDIVDAEIFEKTPIRINFINKTIDFNEAKIVLSFLELTKDSFSLIDESNAETAKLFVGNKNEFHYGELIKTRYGYLVISKSNVKNFKYRKGDKRLIVKVTPFDDVVEGFIKKLTVTSLSKTSSVVDLSIVDPVKEKGELFLDNLVQIYNENAVADKNYISETTSRFISNRLKLITQELEGV